MVREKSSVIALLLILSLCGCLTMPWMDKVDGGLRNEWKKERIYDKIGSKLSDSIKSLYDGKERGETQKRMKKRPGCPIMSPPGSPCNVVDT